MAKRFQRRRRTVMCVGQNLWYGNGNYHKGQQLPRKQLRNDFRTDYQGECACVYTKFATLSESIWKNKLSELSCWFLSLPKIGRFSPPFEWLFCPSPTPWRAGSKTGMRLYRYSSSLPRSVRLSIRLMPLKAWTPHTGNWTGSGAFFPAITPCWRHCTWPPLRLRKNGRCPFVIGEKFMVN